MEEYCVFHNKGDCGDHTAARKSGLYEISSLQLSVNKQLEKIRFYPEQNVSEVQLISNRSEQDISNVKGMICAFHRFKYGTFWQPSRRCAHPDHIVHPAKKKETVRMASWKVYLHWNMIFPSFPMGGMLCSKHRVIDVNQGAEIGNENHSEETADPDYQPPTGSLCMNEIERDQCKQQMRTFTETAAPDMSPLKFQIISPVSKLSKSSIYYAKRKYKEAKTNFKKKFCENFAPQQGKELKIVLSSSSSSECENDIPESLQHILQAYESAGNKKTKVLILSVLSPNDLSKHDIMHFFKCTKYEIDKARQWRSTYGPGAFEVPEKTTRRKLDIQKCEHFLHYLFESGAIQDVAYGASTLVYDSGEKQIIPQAILTAMKTHTILQYHQFCSEVNYTPLSKISLLHILKVLKPSQRHSLAGLDNTTVEGLEGFQMLQTIINECAPDLEKKTT